VGDVSPRLAGWLAVVGALVLAVLGGYLIAAPPWSIPGAIILVAATILLSVGVVWLHRRSWSEPWPPYVAPSMQKQLRRLRTMQVINSILLIAAIAAAVSAIASQNWGQLLYVGLLLFVGLTNLKLYRLRLRHLRDIQSNETTSSPKQ
jgi:hypothetical protein